MKRKAVGFILALSMLFTACSGKQAADTASAVPETKVEAGNEQSDAEAAVQEEELQAEAVTETDAKPDAAEEVKEEKTDALEYERGVYTDNGYESRFLGLRFTAPEGVYMSTEEELAEIMGMGSELLSEDFSKAKLKYAEMSTISEMMAKTETGLPNIIISLEKLPTDKITLDQYVESFKKQLATVSTMEINVVSDSETVQIGDQDFREIKCEISYQGVEMLQKQYLKLFGKRMMIINITYSEDTQDIAGQMIGAFEAY